MFVLPVVFALGTLDAVEFRSQYEQTHAVTATVSAPAHAAPASVLIDPESHSPTTRGEPAFKLQPGSWAAMEVELVASPRPAGGNTDERAP